MINDFWLFWLLLSSFELCYASSQPWKQAFTCILREKGGGGELILLHLEVSTKYKILCKRGPTSKLSFPSGQNRQKKQSEKKNSKENFCMNDCIFF